MQQHEQFVRMFVAMLLLTLCLVPLVSAGKSFVYVNGELMVLINDTEAVHYMQNDGLGNVRGMYDEEGNEVEAQYYLPFGEMMTLHEGPPQPLKFQGAMYDEEHGMSEFDSYYDPRSGRYITPGDEGNTFLPQSFNTYSFRMNNPFREIMPTETYPDLSVPAPPEGVMGERYPSTAIPAFVPPVPQNIPDYEPYVIFHTGMPFPEDIPPPPTFPPIEIFYPPPYKIPRLPIPPMEIPEVSGSSLWYTVRGKIYGGDETRTANSFNRGEVIILGIGDIRESTDGVRVNTVYDVFAGEEYKILVDGKLYIWKITDSIQDLEFENQFETEIDQYLLNYPDATDAIDTTKSAGTGK
ncbi:MAG: RHS repeat-associated core domain-containing protein [archaeon]